MQKQALAWMFSTAAFADENGVTFGGKSGDDVSTCHHEDQFPKCSSKDHIVKAMAMLPMDSKPKMSGTQLHSEQPCSLWIGNQFGGKVACRRVLAVHETHVPRNSWVRSQDDMSKLNRRRPMDEANCGPDPDARAGLENCHDVGASWASSAVQQDRHVEGRRVRPQDDMSK